MRNHLLIAVKKSTPYLVENGFSALFRLGYFAIYTNANGVVAMFVASLQKRSTICRVNNAPPRY
jgi:hypothetical protein